ncbi:capsid and scaffold protein [Salmonella phage atrejo]|uniref:Capsid and scaffold protein n=2 Tax=Epseptimavirus TaxID=2732017 RepID=A0A5J6TB23_9CAUD|nr:capsid and scaffold protein [Salmonella phage atrejo]QFG07488.1 capsid and scaffold protein [Salmonella phage vB_SenS_SB10]QIO01808.1 capsid and scaffold protein [Salmonella phage atrejo]
MTQKKNPVLEQMKQLEKQIEEGSVDGQSIVNHAFDLTVGCANPLVAGETADILGLLMAVGQLIEITKEELDKDEEVTIHDVLGALDLIVNAYACKRRHSIDEYLVSREITESLLETADMALNGKKLH